MDESETTHHDQSSEERKLEIRHRITSSIQGRLESGIDKEEVSIIQNVYGPEAIPEVITLVESRKIPAVLATNILEGIDDDGVYAGALRLLKTPAFLSSESAECWESIENILVARGDEGIKDDLREVINSARESQLREEYREFVRFFSRVITNIEDDDYLDETFDDYEAILERWKNIYNHTPETALNSYKMMLKEGEEHNPNRRRRMDIRLSRRGLEQKEIKGSKYLPTIGIEIEIPERKKPRGREDFKEYKKALGRYRLATDNDAEFTFEFVFQKSANYEVQARQLYEMYRLGYMNPRMHRYALHINVGISPNTEEDKAEAYKFMWGLLATGWSSNYDRISNKKGNLYGRGDGGLAVRKRGYTEMRPFRVMGLENTAKTLHSAQLMGAAIEAYFKPIDERDGVENRLAEVWKEYSAAWTEIMIKHKMSHHFVPKDIHLIANEMLQAEQGLAEEDNNIHTQSRELVIRTRGKVAEIMRGINQ